MIRTLSRSLRTLFTTLAVFLSPPLLAQGPTSSTFYIPKGGVSQRVVTLVNFGPGPQPFTVTADTDQNPGWLLGFGAFPGPPFADIFDQVFGPGYETGLIDQGDVRRFLVYFEADTADFGDTKTVVTTAINDGNAVLPFIQVDLTASVMTGDLVLRDLQEARTLTPGQPPAPPAKLGDDVHTPNNPVSAVNAATPTTGALYTIQVENEGNETTSYVLEVVEQGSSEWAPKYLIGDLDITDGLRGGGLLFPDMEPGESRGITVEIKPGADVTTEGEQFASIFVLSRPEGEVMDAVAAVGEYFAGGLEATLEAKPGESTSDFNLELTVTNTSAQPATNITPLIDLGSEGELEFAYTGPATPAAVPTLAPGASAVFTRPLTTTGDGEASVVAAARGILQNASGQIRPALSNLAPTTITALPVIEITTDPDRVFKKDEVFEIILTIRHRGSGPKTYEFPTGPIAEVPPPAEEPTPLLMIREFENPEPFTLSESDPVREFRFTALAEKRGSTSLQSTVQITDDQGAVSSEMADKEIIVSPFTITTTVTPEEMRLNQTPLTELGARATAYNQERLQMDQPILRNLFEIEMTVKNDSVAEVQNVNVPGVLDVLSFISSLEEESIGVPLTPLFLYTPDGTRIDLQNNSETPEIDDVTLAAGESVVFAWLLEAYDGNVDPESDDSLAMEFEALVLGSINNKNVRDLGTAEFKIVDKPLVEWGIRPKDGRTNYLSGQVVRVDGFLENVSAEDGNQPKDLLVMMYPIQEGNLGGGFPKKAELPESAFPKYYEIFELPGEGPAKRVDLESFFVSFPSVTDTDGTAKYGVRVWIVEDDDTLTPADSQTVVHKEWSDHFEVTLRGNPRLLSAAEQRRRECIALGIWPIVCGFEEGLFDFSQGIYGLGKFMLSAAETNAKIYNGIIAYEMLAMKSLFDAARGEPDAFKELFRDSYAKYEQLVELGVMAGQAGSQVPMVFDAFVQQSGDAMVSFFDAAFEGDMEEVQFQIGHFLGANPDLLLEPLAVGMTYARLARSARVAEAGAVGDVIAAQRKADLLRQQESVSQRIAAGKADPGVTDLSSVLLPGDKLSRRSVLEIFGIDSDQLRKLQKIARENGVMISFRSRSRLARDLLERNIAWPKPQALKFKTVNEIDVKYLGYPNESQAILEIVAPPNGLINKTGPELEASLDAYMDVMRGKFPELASNDVLFGEVRSRLKTRTEEWADLVPDLNLNPAGESVTSIGSNFEANLQFGTKKERDLTPDIAPSQVRFVKTTLDGSVTDPVTGTARKKWTLDMSEGIEVPNSSTKLEYDPAGNYNFKPVSGDVDFMSILEPNGGMILDADRRLKVYKQLAEAVDMQHGESFTFFIDKARQKYLDGNTFGIPGAEALCTISPFGEQTPTAAFFVKSLSIIEGLNQKFLPVREAIKKADRLKLSEGKVVLEPGKTIITRRPDVTGEYIVMAGAEINSMIDLQFVSRFRPQILKETFASYRRFKPLFVPVYIAKWIGIVDDSENLSHPGGGGSPNLRAPDESFIPLKLNATDPPLLQLAFNPATGATEPQAWEEGSGWRFVTEIEAVELGAPGTLDMLPMTYLTDPVARDTATLPIASLAEMGASGDFFQVGDRVVIAPGTDQEEFGTLLSVDPFTLAIGTIYEHAPGTLLASLGPDDTDRDGDTITGFAEVALGTNPDLFDTDFDGTDDGTEVQQGSDPLVGDPLEFASFAFDPEGEHRFSWQAAPGYRYSLLGSPDLSPGSWSVLKSITAAETPFSLDLPSPFPGSDRAFFRLRIDGADDADADGLNSRDELGLGTDPLKTDTDGDGFSDGEEQALGTDPLNADSKLVTYTAEHLDLLGLFSIRFSSTAGLTYRIESSSSLLPGTWIEEAVVTAISSTTVVEVPANLESDPTRLYRVRALIPSAP